MPEDEEMTTNTKQNGLDLIDFRQRLEGQEGERFWKSLDEIAEEDGFGQLLDREFPNYGAEWASRTDRRSFLKLMGASLALGGLTACDRPPPEKIIPYVSAPEEIIYGRPLFYATTMSLGRDSVGLLVETHEGRPTKVEGNPDHPSSLGAADAIYQASILGLYDPDRSQTLRRLGRISTWSDFVSTLGQAMEARAANQGAGVRILTETVMSPTVGAQLEEILQTYPAAKWVQYDPAVPDRPATMRNQVPRYHFDQADVILVLDSDVMGSEAGHHHYARAIADRRRVRTESPRMSRLYVAESMPSPTGAIADHRFPVRTSDMEAVADMLANAMGVGGGYSDAPRGSETEWVAAVARDLRGARGRAVVVGGDHLSPRTHELIRSMNQAIGAVGTTIEYIAPPEIRVQNQTRALAELVDEMRAGAVEVLLILGGNPVYTAPGDLRFAEAMDRVGGLRAHLSSHYDETSRHCHWHINAAHYLESWGDAVSFDGTPSIIQPMIEPLYGGKTVIDVLNILTGRISSTTYETVREHWMGRATGGGDFERWWQTMLHAGVIPKGQFAERRFVFPPEPFAPRPVDDVEVSGGIEVNFRPDPAIWDGQFANNGWLMEMPRPLTKVTWDNAAYMSHGTAQRLGLRSEQVIEIVHQGRMVKAPVWIAIGHAPDSITLHTGFGRTHAGSVGSGRGFDAYVIRTAGNPWFVSAQIRATDEKIEIACTQKHFSMYGRNLIRAASLGSFVHDPSMKGDPMEDDESRITPGHEEEIAGVPHEAEPGAHAADPDIYEDWNYPGYAWGMSIDTSVCTGCDGCIIACVAENNIPVVGKREVLREREMHWLRIDRYYKGSSVDRPQTFHQPIPCQQCEKAPCEPVCPVGATTHSHEGLNDMTYNRCVGTRYCSNNCPYKVRRFNFFEYADYETESLKLGRNPDVTVRTRGVMEKCTYCVQRINEGRIAAEREGRRVRDGEIRTACQQSCPTNAIVFGDINDPTSQVTKLKAQAHNYRLLEELNTQPRTTYLGTVRNLNPEIPA